MIDGTVPEGEFNACLAFVLQNPFYMSGGVRGSPPPHHNDKSSKDSLIIVRSLTNLSAVSMCVLPRTTSRPR